MSPLASSSHLHYTKKKNWEKALEYYLQTNRSIDEKEGADLRNYNFSELHPSVIVYLCDRWKTWHEYGPPTMERILNNLRK